MEKMITYVKNHQEILKKIMLPAVVIAALIVFWIFGGEEELVLEDAASLESQTEAADNSEIDSAGTGETAGDIYVDIGGEVNQPGVYRIPAGTRLFQVIEEAGGLKETADTDSINQAEAVSDGQKIIIGSRDETSPYYTGTGWTLSSSGKTSDTGASAATGAVRQTGDGFKVNLNRATLEDLQLIPGVGPSTAQKILDYRNTNGNFKSASDLKKISGIGEKTYDNLKDYIEV